MNSIRLSYTADIKFTNNDKAQVKVASKRGVNKKYSLTKVKLK